MQGTNSEHDHECILYVVMRVYNSERDHECILYMVMRVYNSEHDHECKCICEVVIQSVIMKQYECECETCECKCRWIWVVVCAQAIGYMESFVKISQYLPLGFKKYFNVPCPIFLVLFPIRFPSR